MSDGRAGPENGLVFVSLGSIIGFGWLPGALNAAEVAGPAAMLTVLALVCAEPGCGVIQATGDVLTGRSVRID